MEDEKSEPIVEEQKIVAEADEDAVKSDTAAPDLPKGAVGNDKRGVCYLSRIPPRMDSHILKKMLSKRFEVERIYLEKEHEVITRSRQKSRGGRKNVRFIEGWVEFTLKKDAKMASLALNNQLIGGKKRKNAFHDDMWSIKYLSGFKWQHLTEKLVYDQKMR